MILSIVISTWNSMEYLPRCIESIRAMKIPEIEIIVIDGASTDGTLEYSGCQNDIRLLISRRRIAWSEANQLGLNRARGEWICLSNPDIFFNDSFLELFKRVQGSSVLVATPQLIYPDGRLQRPAKTFTPWLSLCAHTRLVPLLLRLAGKTVPGYLFPYQPENGETRVDNPQGSLFIFHRSVLNRLGGHLWHNGYLNGVSDFDAFLNLKEQGIPIILFPQYQVVHYGSYISKKYPSWIEHDQTYGFVLYFRYHPDLSTRISPLLYSILFGLEAIVTVGLDIAGRIVSRNPFFKPRHSAWKAGQRLIGLLEGWRYHIG